jgi:hypothetical protein
MRETGIGFCKCNAFGKAKTLNYLCVNAYASLAVNANLKKNRLGLVQLERIWSEELH